MLGDGRDVELVDGRALLGRLLAPVLRRGAQILVLGIRGRRVKEQALRQPPLFFGNRREPLQFFGVDDGQVQARFGAVIEEDGVHHFARRRRQAE
jgi:hypothetical protein